MHTGFCASSIRSIKYLLSTPPKIPYTGKAIILVVGGTSESMESIPCTYRTSKEKKRLREISTSTRVSGY